jgi:glycosyltransferase involved in cell wall biosynthesis
MQRAGYEALALGRPVVASSTRVLREFFTAGARFCDPKDPVSVAAEVLAALELRLVLSADMVDLAREKEADFFARLTGLLDEIERKVILDPQATSS